MAKITLIGIDGKSIRPRGSGWEVDGVFYATWSNAVQYVRDESKLQAVRQEANRNDRRLLIVAVLALLMVITAALAS